MSSPTSPGSPGSGPHSTYGERANGAVSNPDLDLQHMREDFSKLAGVVAHVAERRLARTRAKAEIAMREAPWMTVSIAAVAGFLLALVVTPRRSHRTNQQWFSRAAWQDRLPDFDLGELSRYAHLPRAPQLRAAPITSRLEQMLDSLSRVDGSAAAPVLEKIKDWYGSVRSAADRAWQRST